MKLRQLFETNRTESVASAAISRAVAPGIAKAAVKGGEKSVDDLAGAVAIPKAKARVQAVANTKEKEKETDQEVAIIFGRFNPPHVGHKGAWINASESPIWYVGTNPGTIGPTDPLPLDVKIECMKAIWPNVAGHIVSEQGWWTLASYVYKKHGPVKLFVVTDEKDKLVYVPGLQKANGIADPKHGYYNFKSIEWRKADRVSSATDLRAAVLEGSRKKFTQAAGVSSETPVMGKPFFDLVSEYLLPYKDQILASMARKAAKAAKKNEDAAGVGTITKQNSTADVNAGTPRKNLKAFHLVKETSSDLTADEMVAILSGQKTQQQVLADRSKPATSGSIPMDRWTKRAKDMLSRGMNEQQVIQQLVKDGLALRLAQQAVQAAQINETFLQELENAMLSEAGMKPIEKSYKASMKNASTLPALNMSTGSGGAYMNYRMSIALAGAPNYPTKMEADNWIGGDPLLSTYTEEEFDMIKQAAKQVGAGTIQNWSGKRSQEVADVNKTSTVAKIKKNKYGV